MWRVTPPGYVHEYGETSAIRTAGHFIRRWSRSSAGASRSSSSPAAGRPASPFGAAPPGGCDNQTVSARHFVKYTFLKVDPAWRRLEPSDREQDKRELMAACEDFADGHLLQSFSLVGTRADAELLLIAEAENLERIHELHVVLAQSGLMRWAHMPYSFLGMRKSSEYSEDERSARRAGSRAGTCSSTRS